MVKAREGDPNVAFAWRLSAHRKGYADVRLEAVIQGDRHLASAGHLKGDPPILFIHVLRLSAYRKGYAGVRLAEAN